MKKLLTLTLFLFAAFALYAGGGKEPTDTGRGTRRVAPASKTPYFEGNGGKGTSLAILIPEGKNLTAAETYLPTLVQGVFVGDLSKFSAISVLDRQSLEKVLTETESGIYKSEEDYSHIGEIANVGYVLTGALTKTASGFALQVQITDTASSVTKASYSGACTAQELDNFTGIKKASLELLSQMGVELTAKGKEELTGVSAQQSINGETALSKAIVAQKNGTVVEALSYYYEAARFDPSLAEAASRGSVLSANIIDGNIGQNIRNDIQRRNAWVSIINECESFFKEHLPFEIVYDPTLTQGKVDYQKETVDLSFNIQPRLAENFKVVQDILQGLNATGKTIEWELYEWPLSSMVFTNGARYGYFYYTRSGHGDSQNVYTKRITISVALVNENGNTLSTQEKDIEIFYYWYNKDMEGSNGNISKGTEIRVASLYQPGAWDYGSNEVDPTVVVFSAVNANDITDKLTIKIISVNGIDAETAGRTGYVRISSGKVSAK